MRNLTSIQAFNIKSQLIEKLGWTPYNYIHGINRIIVGYQDLNGLEIVYSMQEYLNKCNEVYMEYEKSNPALLLKSLDISPYKEILLNELPNNEPEFTVFVVIDKFNRVKYADDYLTQLGIEFFPIPG